VGFENFGTVSYTVETKVADFITYLEQEKVMATRCRKCGSSYFPPTVDCPSCLLSDVEWFEIKGLGKLRTYSVVNYGPSGFENDTPYVLGIVEFESGIKVLGRLSKDISNSDIRVGMGLKVVPVKHDERISYEFQKAS
jgi:hypothetical protein